MMRLLVLPFLLWANSGFANVAQTILDQSGIRGGLVVHLGCGDGSLTGALGASDRYHVQGLAASAEDLQVARANLKNLDAYGRISADRLEGAYLPYVDGLVNLVVAENLHGVPMPEVMRVLCPEGVAYVKKGTGPISRDGPKGAAQKLDLSPFSASPAGATAACSSAATRRRARSRASSRPTSTSTSCTSAATAARPPTNG